MAPEVFFFTFLFLTHVEIYYKDFCLEFVVQIKYKNTRHRYPWYIKIYFTENVTENVSQLCICNESILVKFCTDIHCRHQCNIQVFLCRSSSETRSRIKPYLSSLREMILNFVLKAYYFIFFLSLFFAFFSSEFNKLYFSGRGDFFFFWST